MFSFSPALSSLSLWALATRGRRERRVKEELSSPSPSPPPPPLSSSPCQGAQNLEGGRGEVWGCVAFGWDGDDGKEGKKGRKEGDDASVDLWGGAEGVLALLSLLPSFSFLLPPPPSTRACKWVSLVEVAGRRHGGRKEGGASRVGDLQVGGGGKAPGSICSWKGKEEKKGTRLSEAGFANGSEMERTITSSRKKYDEIF